MLKLAIVLCAGLFHSAAYPHVWSKPVNVVLLKAHEDINATISELEKQFEYIQANCKEITKYLLNRTTEFKEKLMDEIDTAILKIKSETGNLTYRGNGFDNFDCFEYIGYLNDTANAVISNMNIRMDNRLKSGLDDIASIDILFKKEFAKLNEVYKKAEECNRNIRDVKSSVAAMLCTKNAGDEGNRISPKFTRELLFKINSFNLFLATFESSIVYIPNADKTAIFHHIASSARENIKKCIQEKIGSLNFEIQSVR